jgi:hypothetical protein
MRTLHFLAKAIPLSAIVLGLSGTSALAAEPTAAMVTHLAAIQTRGDADITQRITSLNALASKVASAKRLTADQKASLTTQTQSEVDGLTALKAKLDAETANQVTEAKVDFQNIFAAHYIYRFDLPRDERVLAADAQSDAAATLTALIPKLQAYIAQAQAKGSDVSSEQALLTDLQTKSADAQTKSQAVIASLVPLVASGVPGNLVTIQSAATTLKGTRTELGTARTDAQSIVTALKKVLTTVD